jgi:hypothetical protein
MGLGSTHRDESPKRRRPRESGGPLRWIPAPRLRGDNLRGNDVTFDGALKGRNKDHAQTQARQVNGTKPNVYENKSKSQISPLP